MIREEKYQIRKIVKKQRQPVQQQARQKQQSEFQQHFRLKRRIKISMNQEANSGQKWKEVSTVILPLSFIFLTFLPLTLSSSPELKLTIQDLQFNPDFAKPSFHQERSKKYWNQTWEKKGVWLVNRSVQTYAAKQVQFIKDLNIIKNQAMGCVQDQIKAKVQQKAGAGVAAVGTLAVGAATIAVAKKVNAEPQNAVDTERLLQPTNIAPQIPTIISAPFVPPVPPSHINGDQIISSSQGQSHLPNQLHENPLVSDQNKLSGVIRQVINPTTFDDIGNQNARHSISPSLKNSNLFEDEEIPNEQSIEDAFHVNASMTVKVL